MRQAATSCNKLPQQAELRDHHRQDGRSDAYEQAGEGIHELSVETLCGKASQVTMGDDFQI